MCVAVICSGIGFMGMRVAVATIIGMRVRHVFVYVRRGLKGAIVYNGNEISRIVCLTSRAGGGGASSSRLLYQVVLT